MVGTDDFAEETLIHAAEDFHGDDVEEIRRFVVAQLADEAREPFVAEQEVFAEVLLEKVAIEERREARRAAIQRAEVADNHAPEALARES